ncbi:MAG: hypothetical protein K8R23_02405 [Chthoniobacter sp.]|nr:hypothetical protein [Chthoniobacter sp.]
MKQAMKRVKNVFSVVAVLMAASRVCSAASAEGTNSVRLAGESENVAPLRSLQVELSGQEHNAIKTSWPGIGCWFPMAEEFKPEGYKRFLELHAKHSAFKLLTTSIRYPVEVTDPKVHAQFKAAAEYARSLGMGIVMELDAPFARPAFAEKYPDELQGIVRLRDVALKDAGEVSLTVAPLNGGTYGFYAKGFDSVAGRLLRVYSYAPAGPQGIQSVEDITGRCKVDQADARGVKVTIPCAAQDKGRTACVMAMFNLFEPDIFAPHLPDFEMQVLQQYADVPLAGVCKDEWGFCPSGGVSAPADLWFSRFVAEEYARRRPGHDLLRDLLLISKGEKGRDGERAAAMNHYMEMYWQRNAEIETKYYHAIKKVFGKDAMVGTHPTWYPYPGTLEVFKNGLDWWAVKRDLAQTDESTPFCVRTALAKKCHSPLWYNMYYAGSVKPYEEDLWRHALGGGRMNFHPLWPSPAETLTTSLLSVGGALLRADSRIRLLNYISTAPIDCPVAVVFSHPRVANWAGPGLGDAGVSVCDSLWKDGYYADLIPSSEIAAGALKLAADGRIQYGRQTYAAVVFYQPQYERPSAGEFFRKAAATGKTALYRIGDWTMDFDGNAVDVQTALPKEMKVADAAACVRDILAQLKASGIEPQTPCTMRGGFVGSMMPKPSGQCRLLDGTVILASGEKDVLGDPIQKTLNVDGHEFAFDAVGVAAVRLEKEGKLEALAAGGLKRFAVGNTKIELPQRIDVALWKDTKGVWQGVLQDYEGEVPADLAALCKHWTRLQVPEPMKE